MFAKMILPILGGTPAVWNTCIVFYQVTLLLGYGYAHLISSLLSIKRQVTVHIGLFCMSLLLLPIAIFGESSMPGTTHPILWILLTLTLSIGLPFFMVSATSPLLQRWFSMSTHPLSHDPYFLYRASNLGSIAALLAYPVLIEMYFRLTDERMGWSIGYGMVALLTLTCAVLWWRTSESNVTQAANDSRSEEDAPHTLDHSEGVTTVDRARWIALSFVPSSLMLCVTTYLTTDISSLPLLWVIPLTIYLLTFIIVFARVRRLPHSLMVRAMPMALLALILLIITEAARPAWLVMLVHLLTLFVVAMVCHGELANRRPAAKSLTEFYLWIGVGGALGGIFNALLGPLIFNAIWEYPLTLVLAGLLMPQIDDRPATPFSRWMDLVLPLGFGLATGLSVWALEASEWLPSQISLKPFFTLPTIVCYLFSRRPVRFGLALGALFLTSLPLSDETGRVMYTERSFFGVHRVTFDAGGKRHWLLHGRTIHGGQYLEPLLSREPISYYHRTGPVGQIFSTLQDTLSKSTVAVVGLGTGALTSYSRPGQKWTFFEIDPTVEKIARNPRYFTFLRDAPVDVDVVLGDGRISLQNVQDGLYDVLVIDAFGSDAIPIHLFTREAIQLYLGKLTDKGILIFHISNLYLNLRPVLGDLAKDANLFALSQEDRMTSPSQIEEGKLPSRWVVMSRDPQALDPLSRDPRWQRLTGRPGVRVWTDDYSNILQIFRWD